MGSKKTQADRRARLAAAGVTEEELDRLRGPIGLDLGGRAPSETALAILAEVVAERRAGSPADVGPGEGSRGVGRRHGKPQRGARSCSRPAPARASAAASFARLDGRPLVRHADHAAVAAGLIRS